MLFIKNTFGLSRCQNKLLVPLLVCFRECHCWCVSGSATVDVFQGVPLLVCFRECHCWCVSRSATVGVFQGVPLLVCFRKYHTWCVSWSATVRVFQRVPLLVCFRKCHCWCVSGRATAVIRLHPHPARVFLPTLSHDAVSPQCYLCPIHHVSESITQSITDKPFLVTIFDLRFCINPYIMCCWVISLHHSESDQVLPPSRLHKPEKKLSKNGITLSTNVQI